MSQSDSAGGERAVAADCGRSVLSLFHQLRSAQGRVAALHSRSDKFTADAVVPEVLQELDTAHEELRVAEEHLHAQADALALAQSALEVEGRRYRELFDGAPEAYLLTDLHGNIRDANQRAGSLLNLNAASLFGKTLRQFVSLEDMNHLMRILERLRLREPASTFELRLRPHGGVVTTWTGISVCSAFGLDGQPVALRWLIRDIATWKANLRYEAERTAALEEELRERTRELEATRYLLEQNMLDHIELHDDLRSASQRAPSSIRGRLRQMRGALGLLSTWLQLLQAEKLDPAVRRRGFETMQRALRSLTEALNAVSDTRARLC